MIFGSLSGASNLGGRIDASLLSISACDGRAATNPRASVPEQTFEHPPIRCQTMLSRSPTTTPGPLAEWQTPGI